MFHVKHWGKLEAADVSRETSAEETGNFIYGKLRMQAQVNAVSQEFSTVSYERIDFSGSNEHIFALFRYQSYHEGC